MGLFRTKCGVCGCTIHGKYTEITNKKTGQCLYNVCLDCDDKFKMATSYNTSYPTDVDETKRIVGIKPGDKISLQKNKGIGSQNRYLNIIIAFTVCVFVVVFAVAITSGGGGGNSASSKIEDTYGHDEFEAQVIAEEIVEGKLKSPSTAEFCEHSEYTITCSGDTWTVTGYVDAQNSFGATLRNNFTVKFTFESNKRYTIDYCNIES